MPGESGDGPLTVVDGLAIEALRSLSFPVVLVSGQGMVLFINEAACHCRGAKAADCLNRPVWIAPAPSRPPSSARRVVSHSLPGLTRHALRLPRRRLSPQHQQLPLPLRRRVHRISRPRSGCGKWAWWVTRARACSILTRYYAHDATQASSDFVSVSLTFQPRLSLILEESDMIHT